MRIIGGKDYYDGCAMFGIDPDIVFARTPIFIEKIENINESPIGPGVHDKEKSYYSRTLSFMVNATSLDGCNVCTNIKTFTVCFCGKEYSGIMVEENHKEVKYFYNKDSFIKWVETYGFYVSSVGIRQGSYNYFSPTRYNDKSLMRAGIVCAISRNAFPLTKTPFDGMPHKINWIVNSYHLQNIGFASVVDGYTAHQEIMMWIGNMKTEPENMVHITDDSVKIAKHGFDKWSFRKKVR